MQSTNMSDDSFWEKMKLYEDINDETVYPLVEMAEDVPVAGRRYGRVPSCARPGKSYEFRGSDGWRHYYSAIYYTLGRPS